jgi:hypothetical protein
MCSRTFAQKMAFIKWMLASSCDRQGSQRKWRKHGCHLRSTRRFWSVYTFFDTLCISFMRNLCYVLYIIKFCIKIFKPAWNRSNPTLFISPVLARIIRVIYFIVMWVTCRDLQPQNLCVWICMCMHTPIHLRSGSRNFLGVTCPGCKGFFFFFCSVFSFNVI